MDTLTIAGIAVAIAAGVLLLGALFMLTRSHHSSSLRDRYGTEYDRLAKQRGRRKAERELEEREKSVATLPIRELTPVECTEFGDKWNAVQAKFVDAPRTALQHADVLVQEVMSARGYPVADFEQRAAMISVDHSKLVSNYRAAHGISLRANSATTEEMRQAMLYYRELFAELLGSRPEEMPRAV